MCFSSGCFPIAANQVIRISLLNIVQHHIRIILKRYILELLIIEIHTSIVRRLLTRLPNITLRVKCHYPVAKCLALLDQLVLSLLFCLERISLAYCLQIENFYKQNEDVLGVFCENGLALDHVFGVGNVALNFKKLFDVESVGFHEQLLL